VFVPLTAKSGLKIYSIMPISTISREADGRAIANRRAPNDRHSRSFLKAFQYVMLLCIPAIFAAMAYFYWVAKQTTYPFEFDYGEGIVLWQAAHVTRLASAYASISQYPYIVFHYPPVYHLVSWAVSRLTGDLLFAGRLVSLVSTIALCLTLGWTVYRAVPARAPKLAPIGGAILAAALPCGLDNMDWALLMRVDMLGLWLAFAGLAVFIFGRASAMRYAAFVLFVAAMYTKQSLIAGALACLVAAVILNLRQAMRLLLFTAVLGALVLTLLVFATHGQVIRHLFLYNQNTFSFRRAIRLINENIGLTLPLLALALVGALSPLADAASAFSKGSLAPLRVRLTKSTYRLALFTFAIHFVISGIVSLTVGKAGANSNYLLEWNLSACALAGLVVARLIWSWRSMRRLSSAAAVAYLLPLLMIAQQAVAAVRFIAPSSSLRQEYADNVRTSQALLRILRSSPEPVMSENMTLLYQAGKQVPFEPAIITQLAATGVWDETPLIDMIHRRAFSVMLIHDIDDPDRYSPAIARAIKQNYEPGEEIGQLTVYRPASSRQPQATVPDGNRP
jgi:hypothetical protein